MKFRKYASAVLAVCCLAGMTACGSSTGSTETTSAADSTSAAAPDSGNEETSAAADNTAYADRVLKVGVKDSVIGFGSAFRRIQRNGGRACKEDR